MIKAENTIDNMFVDLEEGPKLKREIESEERWKLYRELCEQSE